MRKVMCVLLMVLGGVVGGWVGYWVGHAAGWSTNAVWPWTIGGGTGAILASVAFAVLGVLFVALLLILPAYLIDRRLAAKGTTVPATIRQRWSRGLVVHGPARTRQQYGFLVDVHLPDGSTRPSHAVQWLTADEFAGLVPDRPVNVRLLPGHPRHALIDVRQHQPTAVRA